VPTANDTPHDIIVIGGGSAGLMAAIAASAGGARVLILEKGGKLGRKLGISGGGRCNVTNNKDTAELIKHIPGNGKFLYSALSQFGSRDIIAFFERLGIRLKEEDNGRMFPVTDSAKTVVDTLIKQVRRQGVEIRLDCPVRRVLYRGGKVEGVLLHNGETVRASRVIVAVGGKSVPRTGSTGDGYAWAMEAGHTVTPLYPTEVPLVSREPFIRRRELQGLSLRDVALTVWNAKGKPAVTHRGDMLFTHFGLSGPAALRCSQFVVKELAKAGLPVMTELPSAPGVPNADVGMEIGMEKGTRSGETGEADGEAAPSATVRLTIDLFPDVPEHDLYERVISAARAEPKKMVKTVLRQMLPDRIVPVLLNKAELDGEAACGGVSGKSWTVLSRLMKAFPVEVSGTLSLEEAFVTGGGVHLKEIDPKTMQSKIVEGLYFCGEILDVHGYTGGYNITAAFATGYAAGKHAAESVRVNL